MDIKQRMQAVLRAEAEAINAVDVSQDFVTAVEVMQACEGKILTTGIGKAGHIAKKFAATLCSTATPADFIHPAEAAHGDLGLVGPNDVMIAFSTSGKSREVIEILEMSRHLGVTTIIGVTSHPDSELRDHSDLVLDMGVITEPCPLGLTPSASMAVMLAISDALALALLEQKGVTREDYGLRHHGGYLGKAARNG
ncbi:MAG: SIS domain-containing protein [Pseudomonadota bacterium]|nr:SIS domain-containing protein [Pseudomonadota bacterium]MEC7561672.1 SIS domain-containing protein [Pseudomonadota bacterium]MEC7969889.1 SIS domain-containing protein [Pseudomonadota bacterium]MEC7990149.1 SIS domain-containing protein [Pseudomonadota bacterium]MEC8071452.1 SIS domain-containing protein [Pseudomonadota bacterium]